MQPQCHPFLIFNLIILQTTAKNKLIWVKVIFAKIFVKNAVNFRHRHQVSKAFLIKPLFQIKRPCKVGAGGEKVQQRFIVLLSKYLIIHRQFPPLLAVAAVQFREENAAVVKHWHTVAAQAGLFSIRQHLQIATVQTHPAQTPAGKG